MQKIYAIAFLVAVIFSSCEREKNIKINLPPFRSELTAECYIYPHEPLKLLLTQTQDYFDSTKDLAGILNNLFVENADVKIIYQGKTYQLRDTFDNAHHKIYNYELSDSLPYKEGEPIYLQITDGQGRSISAQTQWLKKTAIDSAVYHFARAYDSTAILRTYFKDDAAQADYYRLAVKKIPHDTFISPDSIYNYNVVDYPETDVGFNGKEIMLGGGRDFQRGDTAIVSLFHINHDYFRFIQTTNQALNANFGGPFSQPAAIEGNITGGLGIFTALSVSYKIIVIK